MANENKIEALKIQSYTTWISERKSGREYAKQAKKRRMENLKDELKQLKLKIAKERSTPAEKDGAPINRRGYEQHVERCKAWAKEEGWSVVMEAGASPSEQ